MNTLTPLLTGLLLLSLPLQVSAQQFAYQRTINVPSITNETSVWVPLDLHAVSNPQQRYQIQNSQNVPVPLKEITEQVNLLHQATLQRSPNAADTIPVTHRDALTDNNPESFFQPVTSTKHTFRFSFSKPVAPEYFIFQLQSGWVEHVDVRSGQSAATLAPTFVGTPSGTQIKLSGEQAKVFDITMTVRSGVLQIAEMKLTSPQTKLLFRAQPNETYTLLYGTDAELPLLDTSTVFADADTREATLGAVALANDAIDSDGDNIPDPLDNCPNRANASQRDRDGDSIGDVCDNAPHLPNRSQVDTDKDGIGDHEDNCPNHANADQRDVDLDGIGWVCDDLDNDGIRNEIDNCVGLPNRDQSDIDGNGRGDACEDDRDGDGIPRTEDNCSTAFNPDQADEDGDGIGNTCDVCPEHYDPAQIDRDGNGIGDVCQAIIEEALRDQDDDGIPDVDDNCKLVSNADQLDDDGDGVGSACDNCPLHQNKNQWDSNHDGQGNVCTDTDGDGYIDPLDNCAAYSNSDQRDKNENGIGDPCDDDDRDGIENGRDNCQFDYNPYQSDQDRDDIGNVCDESDDRWTEQRPWLLWLSMGGIILVLVGMGAWILRKSHT